MTVSSLSLEPIKRPFPFIYKIYLWFIGPFVRFYFRLRTEGEFPIPPHQGAIVASNHVSFLDPPLLAVIFPVPLHFMATAKYRSQLFLRWLIPAGGSFFVSESGRGHQAYKKAVRYLDDGQVVAIFPEGTRSEDNHLKPGRQGVVRLALTTGVPIIPCGIVGTYQSMPRGVFFPRRRPVTIRIGRPLDFSAYREKRRDPQVLKNLTEELMDRIRDLVEKPVTGSDPP